MGGCDSREITSKSGGYGNCHVVFHAFMQKNPTIMTFVFPVVLFFAALTVSGCGGGGGGGGGASEQDNPPVISEISGIRTYVGDAPEQIDLSQYISDDKDEIPSLELALVYQSDSSVIDCRIIEQILICGDGLRVGESELTIEVKDSSNQTDTSAVPVSVLNTEPSINVPNQVIYVGGAITIDVGDYCTDREDDIADLSLSISSPPDASVATCYQMGMSIQCDAVSAGVTEMELKVTDTNRGETADRVEINVKPVSTMPNIGLIAFNVQHPRDHYYYYDVWVINSDGTGQKFVSPDSNRCDVTRLFNLSNNANYLAYLNQAGYHAIMDLNGNILSTATDFGRNREVDWSNDDSHLIYSVYRKGIFKLNTDGTEETLYRTSCFCYDHNQSYSPDGTRVAFVHHEYSYYYYIRIMDNDGSNLVTVDDYNSHGRSIAYDEQLLLQWFPDGNKLAYKVYGIGIIVVDLVQNTSKLVVEANITDFKISLDGTMLFYCSDYKDEFIVHTDTWEATRIDKAFCGNCKIIDSSWIGNSGVILASSDALYYYEAESKGIYSIPFDSSRYVTIPR